MSWFTGTSTDYLDLASKLVQLATRDSVVSATLGAGGSGYAIGDILTVSGGTFGPTAAKIRVLTLSGSAVATFKVQEGGGYTAAPSNQASTTGGTGTGATFNLTLADTGWTALRDTTWAGGSGSEKEVILEGTGAGSDAITVGLRTFRRTVGLDTAYSWALNGMTGFNSGLAYEDQPGVSPGALPNASSAGGAYVPLHNGGTAGGLTALAYWLSITSRRIEGVVRMQDSTVVHYSSFYLGFMNPFNSAVEWPYPILVAGCSAFRDALYDDQGAPTFTGLTEMIGINGLVGPCFFRKPDSTWVTAVNSLATISPTDRAAYTQYGIFPGNEGVTPGGADAVVGLGNFGWHTIIRNTGIPGAATLNVRPTPDSGGAKYPTIPATLQMTTTSGPDRDMLGELDGVFWIPHHGITREDYARNGDDRYRVFPCGNRNELYSLFAIKEE